jgi:hypothetical protein
MDGLNGPADEEQQSIPAPLTEKDGIGLLLAIRQWEPPAFRRLRRSVPSDSSARRVVPRPAITLGIGLGTQK